MRYYRKNRLCVCRIFIATVLMVLFSFGIQGCKQEKQPASGAISYQKSIHDSLQPSPLLEKAINEIPPGSSVLVQEKLKSLVPDNTETNPFFDQFELWKEPDTRPCPILMDYILAPKTQYLMTVIAYAEHIWQPIASKRESDQEIYLLKNICKKPEDCLESPAKQEAAAKRFTEMVKIKKGPHIYRDQYNTVLEMTVDDFKIGKYEVSTARYAKYLNDASVDPAKAGRLFSINDPSSKIVHFNGRYRIIKGAAHLPVFNVSWYGAEAFCKHHGQSLATPYQWQRAAQGGDSRKFPWGNSEDFTVRANLSGNKDGFRFWAPVNAFEKGQSPFGVYNLTGNVYQWCRKQLLMGGSWDHKPEWGNTTTVESNHPQARNTHNGFRCVKESD